MDPDRAELDAVMRALPPHARVALDALARSRDRPVEDVLRDEIAAYISGRLPMIDLEGAVRSVRPVARQAGWLLGRLRRLARDLGGDD